MKFINCIYFNDGACIHQAAPVNYFGKPDCLLLYDNPDPRIIKGCALKSESKKPVIQNN